MNAVKEATAINASHKEQKTLCLIVADGVRLVWGDTILVTTSGDILSPVEHRIETRSPFETRCRLFYKGGLESEHIFFRDTTSRLRVETQITNDSIAAPGLARVIMGRNSRLTSSNHLDRVFWQTEAMDGFAGVDANPEMFTSWGMAALTQASGGLAFLAGLADHAAFHGEVSGATDMPDQSWQLSFSCELEGRTISRNSPLKMPDLFLRAGNSLAVLLEEYATDVGQQMGVHSFPSSPHGWCSWYCYYGTENEQDILANLEGFSRTPLAKNGAVFQIDDGWNLPSTDHARVWGDWQPGGKFPKGMAWIADKIRERHLTPGLWLAPFSVDRESKLAMEHPEWLIQAQDNSGKLHPASVNGGFALDLTHEEVLHFIRATFRRVFSEWGFDYVKIDFLKHAVAPGIRRDPSITSQQALRNALRIIREEAGCRRFILACGSPFGPAIGICDAMRIGMDVGGGWDPPLTLPEWPDGNCCIKAAAKHAFYRHWMHRRWWINDPDCLIVRESPLSCELEALAKIVHQFLKPAHHPQFCLTDNEAEFWTNLVSMLGGSIISSDIWTTLPPDRQKLLEQNLFTENQPVRWIDWYENPDLCFLQTVTEPLTIGIFNFSDQACTPSLPAEKLGLYSWRFEKDSEEKNFSGSGSRIEFPSLPPRSAHIWHSDPRGLAESLR